MEGGYPQSEYADNRLKIYLITYQQLNNHRAAFDTATEILKTDPNDAASIQEILGFVRALMPQQANATLSAQNKADLDTAEKVARGLLANPDAIYGPDKKPQGVADDAWAKTKPTMVNFAQFTLGYIALTRKGHGQGRGGIDEDPAGRSRQRTGVLYARGRFTGPAKGAHREDVAGAL